MHIKWAGKRTSDEDIFTSLTLTITTRSCTHIPPISDSQGLYTFPYHINWISWVAPLLSVLFVLAVQIQAPPTLPSKISISIFQILPGIPPQPVTLLHQVLVCKDLHTTYLSPSSETTQPHSSLALTVP